MKQELDEKLCAKYPLIFGDRNKPMTETAMCWGFGCGDGWYNLLDVLCELLTSEYRSAKSRYEFIKDKLDQPQWEGSKNIITQEQIDTAKAKLDEETLKVPVASQVKEKFGGLRFYVWSASEKHFDYIDFAESMSYRICEVCGNPGKRYTDGWHQTLCETHAKEYGREMEYENE